jgi:hypothetical protein
MAGSIKHYIQRIRREITVGHEGRGFEKAPPLDQLELVYLKTNSNILWPVYNLTSKKMPFKSSNFGLAYFFFQSKKQGDRKVNSFLFPFVTQ